MRTFIGKFIYRAILLLIRAHVRLTGEVPSESGVAIDLDRAITDLYLAKERLLDVSDHLKRVRGF